MNTTIKITNSMTLLYILIDLNICLIIIYIFPHLHICSLLFYFLFFLYQRAHKSVISGDELSSNVAWKFRSSFVCLKPRETRAFTSSPKNKQHRKFPCLYVFTVSMFKSKAERLKNWMEVFDKPSSVDMNNET